MAESPLRGRSGQVVLFLGGRALKVGLSGRARRSIRREAKKNRLAQRDPAWRDLVVPVHRIGCVLVSRRHSPALPGEEGAVTAFLDERLTGLAARPRRPAPNLIDLRPLRELTDHGLDEATAAALQRSLAAITLPRSASHGDFFAANMVFREGRFALIDWDSYRPESSFFFDAVHYHLNRRQIELGGKSWTLMVFDDFDACPEVREILERLDVPPAAGMLAYALDRLSREIAQEGGVSRLAPAKLEKYLVLCRRLGGLLD